MAAATEKRHGHGPRSPCVRGTACPCLWSRCEDCLKVDPPEGQACLPLRQLLTTPSPIPSARLLQHHRSQDRRLAGHPHREKNADDHDRSDDVLQTGCTVRWASWNPVDERQRGACPGVAMRRHARSDPQSCPWRRPYVLEQASTTAFVLYSEHAAALFVAHLTGAK